MSAAPTLYFDLGSPYSYLAVERAPSVRVGTAVYVGDDRLGEAAAAVRVP